MPDDFDAVLQIEHVFSCEIEPFKQAYIERNFSPPILFRDIRELCGTKAYTAYGSLVDVPVRDVDILIAGTSCVDYSNLNNWQASYLVCDWDVQIMMSSFMTIRSLIFRSIFSITERT